MAKLPTHEDLGGLPSVRTGRPTPRIESHTPDVSVATRAQVRAIEQTGRARQDAAQQIGQSMMTAAEKIGQSQMRHAEAIGQSAIKLAEARGVGRVAMARGMQAFGEGLSTLSESIHRRQEEEEALALLRADADLKLRNTRRVRELLDNDPDYAGWSDKYLADAATDVEAVAATIPNSGAAEKFRIKGNLEIALENERLLGEASKRDRVAKLADVKKTLGILGERYVVARDDAERDQIIADYHRTVDAAIDLGLVDDIEGLKFVDDKQKFIEGTARVHIAQDPAEAHRLLNERGGGVFDAIREAEGTSDRVAWRHGFASGFDLPLGYGKYGLPPKPLTEMTLQEVYDFGRKVLEHPDNPYNSSAMGAFQIVGTTMAQHMEEAGLSWNDKFSPENQKRLAAVIVKREGFGAWEGFKGKPELVDQAQAAITQRSGRYKDLDELTRAKLIADAEKDMTTVGTIYEARTWEAKNLPAIPTDGDVKKRFSAIALEEKWIEGIINQNLDVVDSNIIPRVTKYGIIPEEVKGSIAGLLASSDPSSIMFGLTVMDKVQRAHPGAFNRDTNDEMVELLARYRISGQYQKPEEFAAEVIAERSSPTKTAAREARTTDGKAKAEKLAPYLAGYFYEGPLSGNVGKQEILPRQIRGALAPGITQNPAEWEEVQQEFISLYSAAYERYGSHDKAMPAAMAVLKRSWSVSKATGEERIMRWAPEMFNPEGVDPAWIQLQARARLYPLIGDGSFILETDDRTDTEVKSGKLPTWLVSVPAASFKTKTAAEEGYKVVKMKAASATGKSK